MWSPSWNIPRLNPLELQELSISHILVETKKLEALKRTWKREQLDSFIVYEEGLWSIIDLSLIVQEQSTEPSSDAEVPADHAKAS